MTTFKQELKSSNFYKNQTTHLTLLLVRKIVLRQGQGGQLLPTMLGGQGGLSFPGPSGLKPHVRFKECLCRAALAQSEAPHHPKGSDFCKM